MRWMWIDRITEYQPGKRMVAIKGVSAVEDHIHEHFAADQHNHANPVMPASLIIEGMAQTAGILVGLTSGLREKVVLAKINRAEFFIELTPGMALRFTTEIERLDDSGAATRGTVQALDPEALADPQRPATRDLAAIDLMFSHIDRNMAGLAFPEHNFVFGDNVMTLLRTSGIPIPNEQSRDVALER